MSNLNKLIININKFLNDQQIIQIIIILDNQN